MRLNSGKAGLIFGSLEHHLDHLAPFCSLQKIPLVLTDDELAEKARLYYPELEVILWNTANAPIEVVKNFDTIVYSTPRILFDEVFFIAEASLQKKLKTVWLPHGNSDKGHLSYFMEGLKDEKSALVYGPKMIDFLKMKQVYDLIPEVLEIGNFRLTYYQKHKAFYDQLMQTLSLSVKKIILYAPTWQDTENSSSFFEVTSHLIEKLPAHAFLLIKLHPNLLQDIRTQQFMLQHESNPSVVFLQGFTPIYPLLERADVYLGDMSSVGYDFLYFNRPMFFFNPTQRDPADPGLYLHQCGRTIENYANIYDLIEQDGPQSSLAELRKKTYEYTFGNREVKPLDI